MSADNLYGGAESAAAPAADVAAFDAGAFETIVAAEVRIKDPLTDAPTPAVFSVAGPEHPLRKRLAWDRQRRARAHLQKTGRMKLDDPEDAEAFALDEVVASVLGWRDFAVDGKRVDYSADAARTVLADPRRGWLVRQLREAMDAQELFIRRSASA